ncbi:MAG: biotin-dependent carboxyltransferase family protein [Rhodobacteraceae bacterium]|nr:biotin-dependent carboxyltransferase family protein [Paracoccaceae bacterium]
MTGLIVHAAGPGVTVQDLGRAGWLAYGLSRGGAADRLALAEGAALLGQSPALAALEMAGTGGSFGATGPIIIALTGAPMRAMLDGAPLLWNASHALAPGQRLQIGAAMDGVYGYLHVAGGIGVPEVMGSRSAHLSAGIGAPVVAGDVLPAGPATGARAGRMLEPEPRFAGGTLRLVPSAQTGLFSAAERARFEETAFVRDARGNRQGVRLAAGGAGFRPEGALTILSEIILPGDVQVTGDGAPYILLSECQTMGGYPRIGTVVPGDLPRAAQAAPGTVLRFRFVEREAALADHRRRAAGQAALAARVRPMLRDPADMGDLLSYQLIGGVTAGEDAEE